MKNSKKELNKANPQDGELKSIQHEKSKEKGSVDKYAHYKIDTGNLLDYAGYLKTPSYINRRDYSGSDDYSSDDQSVTNRNPIARKKGTFSEQVQKKTAIEPKENFQDTAASNKTIAARA